MIAEHSAENIPPGYKQTEVGVIPENWEVKSIGDLVSISVGRDLKEENYSTYQDNIFKYPVFSNTVTNEGLYGFYNIPEYNGESLTIIGRGVGLGTAFARKGGFGAIGRLLVLFPVNNVNTNFLTEYINNKVNIFTESAGIPQLTGISIAKYRIPIPPTISEQESIAEALSDTDAFIESLEQLIAKKRQIKQGAMQELLTGKRRLLGFETRRGYKQTEVGAIPEDWNTVTLSKVCTLHNGRAYALHEWETTGVPVIRLQNLTGGNEYYYSTLQLPEKKYCYRGDLLYMWSATFGPYIWMGDKAIYHYHIWKVVPQDEQSTRQYLYYKLMDITEEKKMRASNGGTMLHVTKESMESTLIALPPLPEQIAIATILSDMDSEITSLEEKLAKARQIKQGMMQELLTGRIRLI